MKGNDFMYGYIYKTINIITNQIYIGKKKSDKFFSTYYGSGKNIKNTIKLIQKIILIIIKNDKSIYFESLSELKSYLKDKYDYRPDNKTLKKIINNSKNNIGYKPFHKSKKKLNKLTGMKIFILDEGVETNY